MRLPLRHPSSSFLLFILLPICLAGSGLAHTAVLPIRQVACSSWALSQASPSWEAPALCSPPVPWAEQPACLSLSAPSCPVWPSCPLASSAGALSLELEEAWGRAFPQASSGSAQIHAWPTRLGLFAPWPSCLPTRCALGALLAGLTSQHAWWGLCLPKALAASQAPSSAPTHPGCITEGPAGPLFDVAAAWGYPAFQRAQAASYSPLDGSFLLGGILPAEIGQGFLLTHLGAHATITQAIGWAGGSSQLIAVQGVHQASGGPGVLIGATTFNPQAGQEEVTLYTFSTSLEPLSRLTLHGLGMQELIDLVLSPRGTFYLLGRRYHEANPSPRLLVASGYTNGTLLWERLLQEPSRNTSQAGWGIALDGDKLLIVGDRAGQQPLATQLSRADGQVDWARVVDRLQGSYGALYRPVAAGGRWYIGGELALSSAPSRGFLWVLDKQGHTHAMLTIGGAGADRISHLAVQADGGITLSLAGSRFNSSCAPVIVELTPARTLAAAYQVPGGYQPAVGLFPRADGGVTLLGHRFLGRGQADFYLISLPKGGAHPLGTVQIFPVLTDLLTGLSVSPFPLESLALASYMSVLPPVAYQELRASLPRSTIYQSKVTCLPAQEAQPHVSACPPDRSSELLLFDLFGLLGSPGLDLATGSDMDSQRGLLIAARSTQLALTPFFLGLHPNGSLGGAYRLALTSSSIGAVKRLANGHVLLMGDSPFSPAHLPSDPGQLFLSHHDARLAFREGFFLGGSPYEHLLDVATTPDSGFIALGESTSSSGSQLRTFLLKGFPNGTISWYTPWRAAEGTPPFRGSKVATHRGKVLVIGRAGLSRFLAWQLDEKAGASDWIRVFGPSLPGFGELTAGVGTPYGWVISGSQSPSFSSSLATCIAFSDHGLIIWAWGMSSGTSRQSFGMAVTLGSQGLLGLAIKLERGAVIATLRPKDGSLVGQTLFEQLIVGDSLALFPRQDGGFALVGSRQDLLSEGQEAALFYVSLGRNLSLPSWTSPVELKIKDLRSSLLMERLFPLAENSSLGVVRWSSSPFQEIQHSLAHHQLLRQQAFFCVPTMAPTGAPTPLPSSVPTWAPTDVPTCAPTQMPTVDPTAALEHSLIPARLPSASPTALPTTAPSSRPSQALKAVAYSPSSSPTPQEADGEKLSTLDYAATVIASIGLAATILFVVGGIGWLAYTTCKAQCICEGAEAYPLTLELGSQEASRTQATQLRGALEP